MVNKKHPIPYPTFHEEVDNVAKSLYESEHYTQALKEASIRLEERCKEYLFKLKWIEMTWVPLMQKLFSSKDCLVPLVNLSLQSNIAKQDAYRDLFAWYMWAIRNTLQHSTAKLDDTEALYGLNIVSYLFYKLDRAIEINSIEDNLEEENIKLVKAKTKTSNDNKNFDIILKDFLLSCEKIRNIPLDTTDKTLAKLSIEKIANDLLIEKLEEIWEESYNYYFENNERINSIILQELWL